jgi:multidrug resistance efflux pump
MGGIVEKVEARAGQAVKAGDLLCVISAMKMEVKVTAPCDGVVSSIAVPNVGTYDSSRLPLPEIQFIASTFLCLSGYRVVEGALLVTLK